MKRFLFISIGLLFFALIVSVIVFWIVTTALPGTDTDHAPSGTPIPSPTATVLQQ